VARAVGGFLIGVLVGIFVFSGPVMVAAGCNALVFALAMASIAFVAGLMLGRRASPKPQPIRLTGRVFEFPQGMVMVEVALKRLKSILPTKVTQSE